MVSHNDKVRKTCAHAEHLGHLFTLGIDRGSTYCQARRLSIHAGQKRDSAYVQVEKARIQRRTVMSTVRHLYFILCSLSTVRTVVPYNFCLLSYAP